MFKIIALIILAAIAIVLVLAANKPDTFRVSRSIVIQAPPSRIFPLIDNFHAWRQWSPWEALDPSMQRSYSGPTSGKGAGYAWIGNSKVGQGNMTIVESTPDSRIAIQLVFVKPFHGNNVAEFTLQPQGNATEVTWVMRGPSPFVSKVMQVFFNMDRMIGKDFEKGLAQLKGMSEQPETQTAPALAGAK